MLLGAVIGEWSLTAGDATGGNEVSYMRDMALRWTRSESIYGFIRYTADDCIQLVEPLAVRAGGYNPAQLLRIAAEELAVSTIGDGPPREGCFSALIRESGLDARAVCVVPVSHCLGRAFLPGP